MKNQCYMTLSNTKYSNKFLYHFAFLNLLLILFAKSSNAQTFILPSSGSQISLGSGCYNLTPQTGGTCGAPQQGVIWHSTTVNFNAPFAITFDAKFDSYSGGGADGIVVAFGQNFTTSTGPNGTAGKIGYYGNSSTYTNRSFGIKFDTYDNTPTSHDISTDHISISLNADESTTGTVPGVSPTPINGTAGITDNVSRTYTITWDPLIPRLKIFMGTSPCVLLLSSTYDFRTVFTSGGMSNIRWGITSGTGGGCSNHTICNATQVIPVIATVYDTVCSSGPITLSGPSGYANYSWSSGFTTSSITVSTSGSYTVTAFNDCEVVKKIFHITIHPTPIFTPTITPDPPCVGQTYTLTAVGITSCPGCVFSWSSFGTTISTDFTTIRPPITDPDGGSIPYELTLTNSFGCSNTAFISVSAQPLPNASFLLPSPLCSGDVVTATIPSGGTLAGSWGCIPGSPEADATGGVLTCGTVTVPTVVTITHTVTSTFCPTDIQTQTVTINPTPIFTPSYNPDPLCPGQTYTITAHSISSCPSCIYSWTSTGLPISSALTVPRPPLTDPDGSGLLYELTLNNIYGCSLTGLLPVHTLRLPSAGSISGPTEGCNDVSYSFLISGNNEVGFWGVTGASGVTIDADGHLIVTGSITEPTTLIITYTVGTGWICGPPSVATHTFTLYPIPTPSPTVTPIPVCSGAPFLLNSGVASCSTCVNIYHWTPAGGTTVITTGDPYAPPPIFDDLGIVIPYNLFVENQWQCKSNGSILVEVHPKPVAGVIKGPSSGCNDDSYLFLVSGNNGAGIWGLEGGLGIITIDPVSGHLIVSGIVSVPITVTITYTVGTGTSWLCGPVSVASHTFTLHPVPVIAPYSMPSTACHESSYTLFTGLTSGCSTCTYSWSSIGSIIATTDPVIVTPSYPVDEIVSIPYDVTVTNEFGCQATGFLSVDLVPKLIACAISGINSEMIPYFQVTGIPGATVRYYFTNCAGDILPPGVATGLPVGTIITATSTPISYPVGTCYMVITMSEYMDCSYVNDCSVELSGSAKPSDREQKTFKSSLSITPNPNKGVFTISGNIEGMTENGEVVLEITDLLGKTILSEVAQVENKSINRRMIISGEVANGIYLLKIKNNAINEVIRFTLSK